MTTVTITAGYYDGVTGSYLGSNADDWSDLGSSPYATWTNWTRWSTNPQNLQIRIDDDLGSIKLRTPLVEFPNLSGTITSGTLKISDTGSFSGEETTYTLTIGTDVEVVSGRYYRWTFTIAGINNQPAQIPQGIFTFYDETLSTVLLQDIDTSTLQTSTGQRIVNHSLGSVDNCQITVHDTFSWVDRAYALPDAWSETTITPIPGIVSKAPLTIVLRDHFGVEVDGRVDLAISGIRPVALTTTGVIRV